VRSALVPLECVLASLPASLLPPSRSNTLTDIVGSLCERDVDDLMRPRHREDPELTSELKANLLEDNMSVVSRIAKAREKVTTACIMHRVCAAFACFSVHVCIGMFALIFRSVRVRVCVCMDKQDISGRMRAQPIPMQLQVNKAVLTRDRCERTCHDGL